MTGEAKRALLSEAGLDLDHPGDVPETNGYFCPYTGRKQVVANPVDPDDTARAGRDCFTTRGKPVRYRAANLEAQVVDAMAGQAMRGTVDLWTASSLPLRSAAALGERIVENPQSHATLERRDVRAAVARHGRLYYLARPTGLAAVHCLDVPQMAQSAGWRTFSYAVNDVPAPDPVSDFHVAEGIAHFRLGNRLIGVHAGTGQHLFTIEHLAAGEGAAVRLAGDRLLVISEHGPQQELSVYDLAALNVTEPSHAQLPPPLHRAVLCGEQEAPAGRHRVWAEAYADGFVVVAADGSLWVVPFDGEPRCRWQNSVGWRLTSDPTYLGSPLVSLYEQGGQPHVAFYAYPGSDASPLVAWLSLADSVVPQQRLLGRGQWASLQDPPCVVGGRLLQVAQRAAAGEQAHDRALDVHALELGSPVPVAPANPIQATGAYELTGLQVAHTGGREVLLLRLREQRMHFVVAYDPGDGGRQSVQWRLFENLLGDEPTVLWDAAAVYAVTERDGMAAVQAKVLP